MRKIWTIIKSEYWRRARTKGFILSTLLGPILMIAVMVAPALLGILAADSSEHAVAVVDETGVLMPHLQKQAGEQFQFEAPSAPLDSVRQAVREGTYDGYLMLPGSLVDGEGQATFYSGKGGGVTMQERIDDLVNEAVRQERLARQNTPPEVRRILESDVPMQMRKLTEEGETADSTTVFMIIGMVMAFLIYFMVLIYGQFVMQGVIEEKASRVVEIVVSSVRPFKLLMGKVLGIGALGLTQVIVWSVFVAAGLSVAGSVITLFLSPGDLNLPSGASQEAVMEAAGVTIPDISAGFVIWFVLFFLGGYLLYASLFAAVGAAVEQQQDAQSMVFPITLLIIIPIACIFFVAETPNTMVSVVLSLIPFFSPIIMVVRVAVTAVPFWQVALSFLLLMGTFVGTMWVSSRIYRTGILMYGKKASFGELWRWVRRA